MSFRLDTGFNPKTDIVLRNPEGRVPVLWFVDYDDKPTRRVGQVIAGFSGRLGDQDSVLAARLVSHSVAGDLACRAAMAAWAQGHFEAMHDALMDAPRDFTEERLRELAVGLSLDISRFEADMYSAETTARLNQFQASYERSAIAQIPAVFINGEGYDAAWDEHSLIEAINRPLGQRLTQAGKEFTEWAASAGLVLVLTTIATLAIYNLGYADWYDHAIHTPIGISWGDWSLQLSFEHWVNDGLMALFFLLVGIEIKREFISGELNSPDKAVLPIVGAIGGMVVPALVYVAINAGTDTAHGWGVPMATDIAFTLGIIALLGSRVPISLKVFISALAIADDLGAI
ncbi:MAG: Na+/H+ antiporter NhaA, partial [Pseudomonadota bacterium]